MRGDSAYVPVTVQWQKTSPVELAFIKLKAQKSSGSGQVTVLFNQIFYTDSTGRLYFSLSLLKKDSVQNLLVRATVIQKAMKDTSSQLVTSVNLHLP